MIVIKKFSKGGFISAFYFSQEVLLCVCHHGVVENLLAPGKDENDRKDDRSLIKKTAISIFNGSIFFPGRVVFHHQK
jgi:hypothetical protein